METMSDMSYIIDTLYVLFAMTLVVFMYPGFAMLEAGIVRTKNVTAVLTINILIFSIASLAFVLVGYSLAFGEGLNDENINYATVLFQMAFVGKAMNVMSGGISERARVIPIAIFTVIMSSVLYPLVVNLTWGSNFLKDTILDISSMHDIKNWCFHWSHVAKGFSDHRNKSALRLLPISQHAVLIPYLYPKSKTF